MIEKVKLGEPPGKTIITQSINQAFIVTWESLLTKSRLLWWCHYLQKKEQKEWWCGNKIEICSVLCNNHCLNYCTSEKQFFMGLARMSMCSRQEVCACVCARFIQLLKGVFTCVCAQRIHDCMSAPVMCVSAHLRARFFVFFNVL